MEEMRCGTCNYFQPLELEGWGTCTRENLWSARAQEVLADMHACKDKGSQWTAKAQVSDPPPTARQSTTARTRPTPSSPRTGTAARRPAWAIWLLAIGIGCLLFSPVVFIIDLFIGAPLIPEVALFWFVGSVILIIVGVVGYFRNR